MNAAWISVDDALPPELEYVLVFNEPGGFFRKRLALGFLMDGKWNPYAARKFRVTHWMPLPKGPDGNGYGMGM